MRDLRKQIPYVPNTGNSCALSCYTMAAKYFFPETTFEELSKVTRHVHGYVIWEMPFWNWIMNRGVSVTPYSTIDYALWADQGLDGLKSMVSAEEFKYYTENTHDLNSYTDDIRENLAHQLFKIITRKPTWEDLEKEFTEGAVCNIVLNSRALDRVEGFVLHQIVILDIRKDEIEFHDPRANSAPRPNRVESIEHFKRVWLEATGDPFLCAYKKTKTR